MSDRSGRFAMQQAELARSLLYFLTESADHLRVFIEQVEAQPLRARLGALAQQIDAEARQLQAEQS